MSKSIPSKFGGKPLESCRLCNSTTSGHDNPKFYDMVNIAVEISTDRAQKINYLMKLAEMVVSSASGCCTEHEHILDAIKSTEKIFRRIEELVNRPS